MAGTRRTKKTTEEEVPLDEAHADDIRAILNAIDDPDEWLAEAYRLGIERVRLHQRLPKSRAMPKRADLDKNTTGIDALAEAECVKRNLPGGRFILLAMRKGRTVSRLEWDVGDPPDEFEAPPDGQLSQGDPSVQLAAWMQDERHLSTVERLKTLKMPGAPPADPIQTVKAVAEILSPGGKGNPEVAAIIQTQGTQVTELMRMLVQKKDEPGIGSKMLAAFAPALPGLLEAAAERFFGSGSEVNVTDASQLGKLDWGGWVKVALHQVISQNPELIQRVITGLAGSATGRPIQLPPMPGQPTEPQPAAEEASMSQGQDPKMKKVRDYVIGRVLAVGAAKAEEDRGPVLRSLVAFLESLDPQGSLGISKLLDSLPDMDVEAATLRLSFFDERFADPGIKPGVEALIAYLREQVTEEPEAIPMGPSSEE